MSAIIAPLLPEELVKDILSYVLVVHDDDFSSVDKRSPFGRDNVSSSAVLLVCKQWLRVGTPLLYECVVLRSTPQALCFHSALQRCIGPQVKLFVRRMRLEGFFGGVVGKIFKSLPRITDLYLRLPKSATEKASGLIQGLQTLDPCRLILDLTPSRIWKNTEQTVGAIRHALQTWRNLKLLKFNIYWSYYSEFLELRTSIFEAVASAPYLQRVDAFFTSMRTCPDWDIPQSFLLGKISQSTSLKLIRVHFSDQRALNETLDWLQGKEYSKIVQCSLSPPCTIESASLSNSSGPIPQLPDKVLERIIDLDLKAHLSPVVIETTRADAGNYWERCRALFCVCKTFHRLAIPLAFRFIPVRSRKSLMWFAEKLTEGSNLLQHVETVAFFSTSRELGINGHHMDGAAELTARSMVARLRNLHNILVTTEVASSLLDMEEKINRQVAQLHVYPTDSIHQSLFSQFANVSHLVLSSRKLHSHCQQDGFDAEAHLCLPNLTSLKIYDHLVSNTINILQTCNLPSVETLEIVLSGDLYRVTCNFPEPIPNFPRLKLLSIRGIVRESYRSLLGANHPNLEKIVLSWEPGQYRDLKRRNSAIEAYFDCLNCDGYPSLKELQFASIKEWLWEEWFLKDSSWRRRATEFINKYGFKITNTDGVPWRPRMTKWTKGQTTYG